MLKLDNIYYKIGDFQLSGVTLDFEIGKYSIMIGPSGSGKTLILNLIAGFLNPHSGKIYLNSKDITSFMPENRDLAYLMQNFALFPHLTVFENVAYSLRVKGYDKKFIKDKVQDYLDFVEISKLAERLPDKLSGGERQRVALARCLIKEPSFLLLDEPFSAIDTHLKVNLKNLLMKIKSKGIGIIHVTHDPDEAVNLSDNISIIENGKVISHSYCDIIPESPITNFMADFFGYKNFFNYKLNTENNKIKVYKNNSNVYLEIEKPDNIKNYGYLIIPQESITISNKYFYSSARYNLPGVIESMKSEHNSWYIDCNAGIELRCKISEKSFRELNLFYGKKVWLSFKVNNIKFL